VCRIATLEGSKEGRLLGRDHLLRELLESPVCEVLRVESPMLHNCSGIGSVRCEYLAAPVHIVKFYQLLFVLIEIFSVGDTLLECLRSETG
jgi:hypothetical protein